MIGVERYNDIKHLGNLFIFNLIIMFKNHCFAENLILWTQKRKAIGTMFLYNVGTIGKPGLVLSLFNNKACILS